MTSINEQIRFTVEEYLEMERQSPERHEYLDGFVCAMAGKTATLTAAKRLTKVKRLGIVKRWSIASSRKKVRVV